jgi:hypothetical protein
VFDAGDGSLVSEIYAFVARQLIPMSKNPLSAILAEASSSAKEHMNSIDPRVAECHSLHALALEECTHLCQFNEIHFGIDFYALLI